MEAPFYFGTFEPELVLGTVAVGARTTRTPAYERTLTKGLTNRNRFAALAEPATETESASEASAEFPGFQQSAPPIRDRFSGPRLPLSVATIPKAERLSQLKPLGPAPSFRRTPKKGFLQTWKPPSSPPSEEEASKRTSAAPQKPENGTSMPVPPRWADELEEDAEVQRYFAEAVSNRPALKSLM